MTSPSCNPAKHEANAPAYRCWRLWWALWHRVEWRKKRSWSAAQSSPVCRGRVVNWYSLHRRGDGWLSPCIEQCLTKKSHVISDVTYWPHWVSSGLMQSHVNSGDLSMMSPLLLMSSPEITWYHDHEKSWEIMSHDIRKVMLNLHCTKVQLSVQKTGSRAHLEFSNIARLKISTWLNFIVSVSRESIWTNHQFMILF